MLDELSGDRVPQQVLVLDSILSTNEILANDQQLRELRHSGKVLQ